MVKNILSAAVASVMLMSANFSNAESYVGVSFGSTDFDANASIISGDGAISDSDSGSKLFFGFQYTPNVALELHYTDLGESSLEGVSGTQVNISGSVATFGGAGVVSSEFTSFGASGVYRFNTEEKFQPFVKLGLHRWEIDLNSTVTGFSDKDDGVDIFYGLGFDVVISESIALNFAYEIYDIDSDLDSTEEVSFLNAGLNYRF